MLKTFIVMGVSGCGKSFVGDQLSQVLGGAFEDADDFHPRSNIEKMAKGIPLTDKDRWPWLKVLRERIILHRNNTSCYILACSALQQNYRDLLRGNDSPETLDFIYLQGTKALIRERMKQRHHFMPSTLLDSQFEILEEPQDAIIVDIRLTSTEIVNTILDRFSYYSG